MKSQTKFIGRNPFTGASTRPKPSFVDVDKLEIVSDPLPQERAKPGYKYEGIFSKLKHGQAIKCQAGEAAKIGHALNTWLKAKKKSGVVKTCQRYEADGLGRVWLLAAEAKK